MTAILAAPVAVEDGSRLRPPSPPSHCHGIFNQAALHVGLQAPSHHLTAEHVNHSSQVQPAFVGSDIGDVTAQKLVGCLRRKTPLHQVRSNRQAVFAVCSHDELALGFSTYAVTCHQLAYPLFANTQTSGLQLFVYARPAVFAFNLCMNGTYVGQRQFIAT